MIEFIQPLDLNKNSYISYKTKIVDVVDILKGALVYKESKFFNKKGELLAVSLYNLFFPGIGSYGGKKQTRHRLIYPEFVKGKMGEKRGKKVTIAANNNLLYRLLQVDKYVPDPHIEEDVSKMLGKKRSIVHKGALFGIITKAVSELLHAFLWLQFPIRKIALRFLDMVFPGEELKVNIYIKNNLVYIKVKVKMRGALIAFGYCELQEREKL